MKFMTNQENINNKGTKLKNVFSTNNIGKVPMEKDGARGIWDGDHQSDTTSKI